MTAKFQQEKCTSRNKLYSTISVCVRPNNEIYAKFSSQLLNVRDMMDGIDKFHSAGAPANTYFFKVDRKFSFVVNGHQSYILDRYIIISHRSACLMRLSGCNVETVQAIKFIFVHTVTFLSIPRSSLSIKTNV